jgi:hypothetical protein
MCDQTPCLTVETTLHSIGRSRARWRGELPIHCQSAREEEIGEARTNRDYLGSRFVVDSVKQAESGSHRRTQDAVHITRKPLPERACGFESHALRKMGQRQVECA